MMRAILNTILIVSAAMMLVASYARATEPTIELQRNPFDRPAADVLVNNAAPVNRGSTSESTPFLRAVLAAGSKSVVDFGGVILQIGESVNGYRLLSVEEGGATFSKEGEKVLFSLYEEQQVEDQ
jgi:hypothetical protein